MSHCLVCGASTSVSSFGKYCSKECRDSDIAVLGKHRTCNECGSEFKSIHRATICVNCLKQRKEENFGTYDIPTKQISPFKYSIFKDNLERIVQGAGCGDYRNCNHATRIITDLYEPSILPEIAQIMDKSDDNTKFWLVEIMAKIRDKRAIFLIKQSLQSARCEKLKHKALTTLEELQNCS